MPQTLLQKLHPYVEGLIPGHSLLQLKRALHSSRCFSAHWHIKSSLPPPITLWYRVIQRWIQRGSWRYREVKWPAHGQMRDAWQRWGKTIVRTGDASLDAWSLDTWPPREPKMQEDKMKPPELTSLTVEFSLGLASRHPLTSKNQCQLGLNL